MTYDEQIIRRRYHGLYLSRKCLDIVDLSRALMGLHCWFHRNVVFSALIRGANVTGWKSALTKIWLYRGTLHGVAGDDLPKLLSLHKGESWLARQFGKELIEEISEKVLRYMEDGVSSRAELRKIFSEYYTSDIVEAVLSSWGGVFVHLAGLGKVAFKDMASRDFDLIDAEPVYVREEILPEMFRRYIISYGPATIDDAAWFFGFWKEDKKLIAELPLDDYESFKHNGKIYYCTEEPDDMGEIPEYNLLSGFDPIIASYMERSAVLPPEHKKKVILKSGICLPTIAVNGKVSGIWNIKKNEPEAEFFGEQPKRIKDGIYDAIENIRVQSQACGLIPGAKIKTPGIMNIYE